MTSVQVSEFLDLKSSSKLAQSACSDILALDDASVERHKNLVSQFNSEYCLLQVFEMTELFQLEISILEIQRLYLGLKYIDLPVCSSNASWMLERNINCITRRTDVGCWLHRGRISLKLNILQSL